MVETLPGSRDTTLLIILDPDSPSVSAFAAVLNALHRIAGAPAIQAVVRTSAEGLEDFKARHRVRFPIRRLTEGRLDDPWDNAVISIRARDGRVVERVAGALPHSAVALARAARDAARTPASQAEQDDIESSRVALRVAAHEARISALPDGERRFFDPSGFPWIAGLERDWRIIRSELDAILRAVDHLPEFQTIQKDQEPLNTDRRWKVFFFEAYGARFEANRARCPETSRLLDTIPGLTTAMFSILRGNKHVPPHRGPFKGVLRFHLGLKIPGPCRIRVENEYAAWREGVGLVFDDTFEHEVWNDSDQDRVVLFVDFLRPLPADLADENRAIVEAIGRSPFVRGSQSNAEAWEESLGKVVDELRRHPTG